MLYENFDLAFRPNRGDTFRVVATCQCGGDATGTFQPPRVEDLGPPGAARDLDPANQRASPSCDARSIGTDLFDRVFTGPVLLCLRECLAEAQRIGTGLRIRLRFVDCPKLAELPWELLYDRRRERFLGQQEETPIVRYLELPPPIGPLAMRAPLRLLVVTAAPRDVSPLDLEGELAALRSELGTARRLLTIEVLERATIASLVERLRASRPHVLHFLGHGREGALVFESESGGSDAISGGRLATMLAEHGDLRLVVLNACEGARAAEDDAHSGVAQQLVRCIPAVVAMRQPISDRAAVAFAASFYQGIARGLDVDRALAATRRRMYVQIGASEWATPALYMRSNDGQLFVFAARPPLAGWAKAALAAAAVLAGVLGVSNWVGQAPGLPAAPLPLCPRSKVWPELEMVQIPAGTFTRGANRADQKPPHEVTITKPFCLSRLEVTQKQWKDVMGTNPSRHVGDRLPVDSVSYGQVKEFIARLNAKEPGYRLPTEAEWEHAARSGAQTPGPPDAQSLERQANCESDDRYDATAPVASFEPNPWGLFDMVGNVSEWVEDWYAPSYAAGPQFDPAGPPAGSRRVRRGGSYQIQSAACSATERNKTEPGRAPKDVGFRLARDLGSPRRPPPGR